MKQQRLKLASANCDSQEGKTKVNSFEKVAEILLLIVTVKIHKDSILTSLKDSVVTWPWGWGSAFKLASCCVTCSLPPCCFVSLVGCEPQVLSIDSQLVMYLFRSQLGSIVSTSMTILTCIASLSIDAFSWTAVMSLTAKPTYKQNYYWDY
jgi:hypothetical protein